MRCYISPLSLEVPVELIFTKVDMEAYFLDVIIHFNFTSTSWGVLILWGVEFRRFLLAVNTVRALPFSPWWGSLMCDVMGWQARQLLCRLGRAIGCTDTRELFERHTVAVLRSMDNTYDTWTQHSAERLVFDALVLEAGDTFSSYWLSRVPLFYIIILDSVYSEIAFPAVKEKRE